MEKTVGILFSQIGSPQKATFFSLFKYLRNFLSDKRIVHLSPIIWQPFLHLFVLPFRAPKSAKQYRLIWRKEGSPLVANSKKFLEKIENFLIHNNLPVKCLIGMHYSSPTIRESFSAFVKNKIEKILFFPLFPQYSGTTWGSGCDYLFCALKKEVNLPTVKIASPYYGHPAYIEALSCHINRCLKALSFTPQKLIFSYHGIPKSYADKGDAYPFHCLYTTERLREKVNFPPEDIIHTYQSRFGFQEWLKPYTDETVFYLAKGGTKKLAIVCPAFLCDCLETLYEIGVELKKDFLSRGGEEFALFPSLNSNSFWIEKAADLIKEELKGLL